MEYVWKNISRSEQIYIFIQKEIYIFLKWLMDHRVVRGGVKCWHEKGVITSHLGGGPKAAAAFT